MSFMRLVRSLLIALAPVGLAGCHHEADRPAWMNRIPLLRATPDPAPPRVNEGRTTSGYPSSRAVCSHSLTVWQVRLAGTAHIGEAPLDRFIHREAVERAAQDVNSVAIRRRVTQRALRDKR